MYPHLPPPPAPAGSGRFACVKAYKRLFILDLEARRDPDDIPHPGCLVYTPPDWVRMTGREKMVELAARASARGYLAVADLISFEDSCARTSGARPRPGNRENRDLPFAPPPLPEKDEGMTP